VNKLNRVENGELEKLINSSGYYRQKTKKLKNFTAFLLKKYDGSLEKLFSQPAHRLREQLLSVKGIGKETADSIMLYAMEKPVFVIDAYTVRVVNRLGISNEKDYDSLQKMFHQNLHKDTQMFNEFHALIVQLGKNYCRKKPECDKCPLANICKFKIKQ